MLLALDLGTLTGYASSKFAGGVVNLRPRGNRFEGGGMRYLRFTRWLDSMHQHSPVSEVVFEEVRRHSSTDSAHVYGGLLATLTAWCEAHDVPYTGVPVQTIKRHATGRGNAKKPDMIVAAQRLGYEPVDDNHADALCLLDYAQRVLSSSG